MEINRLIAAELEQIGREFWLVAEVAQASFQQHAYLELVQQEKGKIVAKSRAAIWASNLAVLKRKIGTSPETILKKGAKVLLLVSINFHEVYGLSLIVSDMDINFALGEMEAKRQQTLAQLEKEQLIGKQPALEIPLVLQKLAIVSSSEAAGYGDFMHHISQNPQGYRFDCVLFESLVQGEKAIDEIVAKLQSIPADFDAVVLIRGGGSKLDLAIFDEYKIARAICLCPIPVLTGIGHQRDASVCDLVAAKSLKTPTAVAEYLINKAAVFEAQILQINDSILEHAKKQLVEKNKELTQIELSIKKSMSFYLKSQHKVLPEYLGKIMKSAWYFVAKKNMLLKELDLKIEAYSPQKNLAKGYSLTLQNGKILRKLPQAGTQIQTLLAEGSFESQVL